MLTVLSELSMRVTLAGLQGSRGEHWASCVLGLEENDWQETACGYLWYKRHRQSPKMAQCEWGNIVSLCQQQFSPVRCAG